MVTGRWAAAGRVKNCVIFDPEEAQKGGNFPTISGERNQGKAKRSNPNQRIGQEHLESSKRGNL